MFYTDHRQEIQKGDKVSVHILGASVQTRGDVAEVTESSVTINTNWGHARLVILDGGRWQITKQSIPI